MFGAVLSRRAMSRIVSGTKEAAMRDYRTKAADAVAYLARNAGQGVDADTTSAILYLADRFSVMRHGHPMLGVSYSVGPVGPECPSVAAALAWGGVDTRDGAELDELSVANERCIDEAVSRFGKMNASALASWMAEPGNLPEWGGGAEAPTLEAVMAATGVPDPAGQAAFERDMETLHETIGALSP
jgi:hypothetical protein